jgi:hypothetical protein
MLGPFDYFIWFSGVLIEGYVVFRALLRKEFLRYFWIVVYLLGLATSTVGRSYILYEHGFQSKAYTYSYYYSDCLLTLLLFLAIASLYRRVFSEMGVSVYLRAATVMLLAGTAWFSYMVVRDHQDHLTSRFVVELSQNLYFVGVVLTYLLWGAVVKLRETRARLVHLVLSLGIFFSAHALIYALRNLFPEIALLRSLPPLVGTFLPLAWAYTFTRIPEEARLAPARVATAHR